MPSVLFKKASLANAATGQCVLSIAVISPDRGRRSAAIGALSECHNGPIREFISYPPNLDDVARTLNRDYDVVVLDLDSDPEYALNLVRSICVGARATVMVFSAKTDRAILLNAMRAGAREYLTLPIDSDLLGDALKRISALRPPPENYSKPDGSLLVFLNAKGGAGATTLATNFAVALARDSGKRTLLIDLNLPLGDVAINLGIKAEHSIANALDHANRLDRNLLNGMLVKHGSGLWVLAAPTELTATHFSDWAIDKLVELARLDFDAVVVDAGAKLYMESTRLFDVTAVIYLVTQIGIAPLRNANRVIQKLSTPGSPRVEIVLNRLDARRQEIAEEYVVKALTRPAEWKIPDSPDAVRRSAREINHLNLVIFRSWYGRTIGENRYLTEAVPGRHDSTLTNEKSGNSHRISE